MSRLGWSFVGYLCYPAVDVELHLAPSVLLPQAPAMNFARSINPGNTLSHSSCYDIVGDPEGM